MSLNVKSPASPLFVQPFVLEFIKEISKAQYDWPFVRRIHQQLTDYGCKGLETKKTLPCHEPQQITEHVHTVYPKKYARGFVVLRFGVVI